MTAEQERQSGELMKRTQDGDQAAYASLLVLLTASAKQFTRARVGSVPWVDDVVQETLIAVHRARQTYDARRPFGPWFYAIASNRLIDRVRRERRITSREVAGDLLPEPPDAHAADRDAIDVEAIQAALAALPSRQREVIEALKFSDQSVREVAGRLKMSESAVKVTAHRGYRMLKRLLGASEGED